MGYFVRMIKQESHLVGNSPDRSSLDDFKADVFTEVVTENNCISVWSINDAEETKQVALALTSSYRTLDNISLLLLDEDLIRQHCPNVKNAPESAKTNFKEFTDRHYDVGLLSYRFLGELAFCVIDQYDKRKLITLVKDQVGELLSEALISQKIEFESLEKNLRSDLAAWIIKHSEKSGFDKMSQELRARIMETKSRASIKPCKRSDNCRDFLKAY